MTAVQETHLKYFSRFELVALGLTLLILTPRLLIAIAEDENPDRVQLLGSIAIPTGTGVALVKDRDTSEVRAIRTGDKVFDLGTLSDVEREQMVVTGKSGQSYTISSKLGGDRKALGKKGPKEWTEDRYIEDGFQRIGTQIEIDSRFRDRTLKEELPKILMEAASEPVMVNGQIAGFRLFQLEENSMFAKLGIKEGDVVSEINGVPLNDVPRTLQLLNSLRQEPNVAVNIMRNGQPVQLKVNVK